MTEKITTSRILTCLTNDPSFLATEVLSNYHAHLERTWLKIAGLQECEANLQLVRLTLASNPKAIRSFNSLAFARSSKRIKINFTHTKSFLTGIGKILENRLSAGSIPSNKVAISVTTIDSKNDRNLIRQNLSFVLNSLEMYLGIWFNFVVTCTRSIGIISINQIKSTSSFALNNNPGITWLINPNKNRSNQLKLACTLIHESLHHLIYMMELYDSNFSWEGYDRNIFGAYSPWTGSALPIHSVSHAWIVWYTLSLFLSAPSIVHISDTESIVQELKQIHTGFANLDARKQIMNLLDKKIPFGHSTIMREILQKTSV